MAPAELIDVPLNDRMAALGPPMKERKFVDAITAPPVPPQIRMSAGMLRNATGFVPSMMAARNSEPNATAMPIAVIAFMSVRSFGATAAVRGGRLRNCADNRLGWREIQSAWP
jgi:hypothetical protein